MTALHEWVIRQAHSRPDALAVALGPDTLSYGELEARSARLADLLRETGCERGDRIALLVEKSPAALVAMLAAVRVGAAYVVLDVSGPAARLARILRSAEPRLALVGAGAGEARARELLDANVLDDTVQLGWLGTGEPSTGWRPAFDERDVAAARPAPPVAMRPEDLLYLMYTSGSTGTPKGVAITHGNVQAFTDWAVTHFGIDAQDRLSGHPPWHFDLSVLDVYCSLAAGAQLHLVPAELGPNAPALAQLIRDSRLTQWVSTPSVMAYLARFDVVEQGDFASLKRVIWCGEVMPIPVLRHWMARVPHAAFTNLYGPTEATVASSHHDVPEPPAEDAPAVPIGRPCAGETLVVLGERLEALPPGAIGELFIGGAGLSPGYWRDAERTREAFLPDPRTPGSRLYRTGDLARMDEDGLLHFVGRADSQIKHRGYRIELGEIEAALHGLDDLADAAVVPIEARFGGTAICCAYTPTPGLEPSPAQLRRRLAQLLPDYMLPARWLALGELPRNVNQKIDRRRLAELFAEDYDLASARVSRRDGSRA